MSVSPGKENQLNKRFDYDQTFLHSSVKLLKYDIVDLLLTYGADVNILKKEKPWRIGLQKTMTQGRFFAIKL